MITRQYFYSGFILIDGRKEYFDGTIKIKSLLPTHDAWSKIRNNLAKVRPEILDKNITITTLNRI